MSDAYQLSSRELQEAIGNIVHDFSANVAFFEIPCMHKNIIDRSGSKPLYLMVKRRLDWTVIPSLEIPSE